nr:NAD-glutamate dehydrogenase [Actinomycetales bacterium]
MKSDDRVLEAAAAEPVPPALRPAVTALADLDVLDLLRIYYRDVPREDLRAETPAALLATALSHLGAARHRSPGSACVRVLGPDAGGLPTAVGTVVEIITDDMPFLVDSVLAELGREGHPVRLLVHPQPRVRRDDDGRLLAVVDDEAGGTLTESWIHLRIDPITDSGARDRLGAALERIVADVRAAVEDWAAMTRQAERIAAHLRENPPALAGLAEVEDAADFLEWLTTGPFVFLGYREYTFNLTGDGAELSSIPESGLGLLRSGETRSVRTLRPAAAQKAAEPRLLLLTKANSASTVSRAEQLDYVAVKVLDEAGVPTGELRFIGVFTPTAAVWPVTDIPYVSRKVATIRERTGYGAESNLGKALTYTLEELPRDELLQASAEWLGEVATAVVHLRHRPRTRVFVRSDDYGRFATCLVYLEQERYAPEVRDRIEAVLREVFGATDVSHTTRVTDATLAQLYFVARTDPGAPTVDLAELERRVAEAARSWQEDLLDAAERLGADTAVLAARFGPGAPEGYKEEVDAAEAATDLVYIGRLEHLADGEIALRLHRPAGAPHRGRRLRLYHREDLALSQILPVLEGLGVDVVDQMPYTLTSTDGSTIHIADFGLELRWGHLWPSSEQDFSARFEDAFHAVWRGAAENDGFNALVLLAGLTWQQVVVLRAAVAYLRQTGAVFSREYIVTTLRVNPGVARLLVDLFEARFDPDRAEDVPEGRTEESVAAHISAALDDVANLDQDRIVRALTAIIRGTDRTNYFQQSWSGDAGGAVLAFKLDPQRIPDLPAPLPTAEIWVYGPGVEGVHLRFGAVARGGLRWSDRREDFRTEVLGLVKAQVVKNAVIVPAGAKGGFVAKNALDPVTGREAWLAAGRAAYRQFIGAMLSVTDNLVDGAVVPPERVVRHDSDDPYLVVAADKGTAAFSDLANEVSAEHRFWLGDAFASGGSAGYDHKAMGITARGAWIAVQHHFRELGIDVQREEFTAVGIGDMSGDVFGNGMLLSPHIRLVAAFDHRHIFLDPDPDAAVSFAERQRLFALSRSSWADYDERILSHGGGVYPRSAKSIPVSESVRRRLALPDDAAHLTPSELIRAVLSAPVDLLWNGGIGTYVKAASETHPEIGDRANDAIRVDGAQLRCRVVGEGGNLGLSQLGRVEAARHGVHLNTDAIDNSAGVDSSDYEVNIKILLAAAIENGRLAAGDRNELLGVMTGEVAEQVLRHNYEQNVLLGNARTQQAPMLGEHIRLIRSLERRGDLDRELEFLPSDEELTQRGERGEGLNSPEFAVLVAYTKLALKADLLDSELPDDPWFSGELERYFPAPLRERFPEEIRTHRLRREIVATRLANSMVDRGGITFVHRAADETGASAAEIARAFVVSREVFDLPSFVRDVESLDNVVDTAVLSGLYLEFRRLLDQSVRWFLANRSWGGDIRGAIGRFWPSVAELAPQVGRFVRGSALEEMLARVEALTDAGVPEPLAERSATLVEVYSLLDSVLLAEQTEHTAAQVAPVRYAAEVHFGVDRFLGRVRELPREERWDSLARVALREDLHSALNLLTHEVIASARGDLEVWDRAHASGMARLRDLQRDLGEDGVSHASLAVAVRTLRGLAS